MRIRGARAVVTGGARGIGRSIADELEERGAEVLVGDIAGAERHLDVADEGSWAAFLAAAGPVDILVSNAGLMPVGPFVSETSETTRRQLDVNLFGVIAGCRAVLPGMLERRRGALVNIASQAGKAGFGGVATYSATKFAVVGLSQALADELHGTGVQVSCVLPGIVATELSSGLPETPLTPRVEPEEVARAVAMAIERGRREVWVPSRGRAAIPLAGALPPGVRSGALSALGLGHPVLDADPGARSAYEARIS